MPDNVKPRKPRGFAAMDPAKVREITSKGGRTSQSKGTAHRWHTREEAQEARRRRKIDNKPTDDEGIRDSVA